MIRTFINLRLKSTGESILHLQYGCVLYDADLISFTIKEPNSKNVIMHYNHEDILYLNIHTIQA